MNDNNSNNENSQQSKPPFFGHTPEGQKKLINDLATMMPKNEHALLVDNIEYLENIAHMSLSMKRDLFRNFDMHILSVSLRTGSESLIKSLLEDVTRTIKEEILFGLQKQKSIYEVMAAQKKAIEFIRKKEGRGEYFLCKDLNATYV